MMIITMDKSPSFSEIWMCNLPASNGSIQNGYRPVFILSNDKNNKYSTTLNVIPLTSKTNKKLPVHVNLWNYSEYGLKTYSTLLVEQITTITVDSLDVCLGKINDKKTLNNICKAISIQFPILQSA